MTTFRSSRTRVNATGNQLAPADRSAHGWYRFVLSYPPHLVKDYLDRFGVGSGAQVLDPFCGTGTTIVECKKRGVPSIGVEAHPMAHFASRVKTTWDVDPDELFERSDEIAAAVHERLNAEHVPDNPHPLFAPDAAADPEAGYRTLPPESMKLLLKDSISPRPLHKVLALRDMILNQKNHPGRNHQLLALARVAVSEASNLHFGPEVGLGRRQEDAAVVEPWLARMRETSQDLRSLHAGQSVPATAHHADSRALPNLLRPESIHAVITSPPYPNEKDYTRTTRLESVLLEFFRDREELRALKRTLVRSNTRGVYKNDNDHDWVEGMEEIASIARAIEERRIALGKTSGFERMYARVTQLYFGGMARHLADLRQYLRPDARLAYVVGDQASYLRVMIRTGKILANIAERLGYQVEDMDLFRTRAATATRSELREEVVVLRWPGISSQ